MDAPALKDCPSCKKPVRKVFGAVYMPKHFRKAIQNYQGRERRYGRTGEQAQAPSQTPLPA